MDLEISSECLDRVREEVLSLKDKYLAANLEFLHKEPGITDSQEMAEIEKMHDEFVSAREEYLKKEEQYLLKYPVKGRMRNVLHRRKELYTKAELADKSILKWIGL